VLIEAMQGPFGLFRVHLKFPGTALAPTTRPLVIPLRACRRQSLLQPPVRQFIYFPPMIISN
jgi:hypothetical protein